MHRTISRHFIRLTIGLMLTAALFLAGCSPLLSAARSGNVAEARQLLDSGADVNENFHGETALIYAAIAGNTEMARLLLERGAAVNASMGYGLTPLVYAAKNQHGELAQLLISHGADMAGARVKLTSIGADGQAGLALLDSLAQQASGQPQVNRQPSGNQVPTLPYLTLEEVPAGPSLPLDGSWRINQGKLRIAGSRMFFTADVPGIARAKMVTIKDIKQTGPRSYRLNGFVAYQGKGYYLPGELQVVSEHMLVLNLFPKPELNLPNGYTEVYTRDTLDNEVLFKAQLTLPSSTPSLQTASLATPNFHAPADAHAIAIVIGIEKYQTLPTATYAHDDAELMRAYLRAMGYQDRNIEFLSDERATFSAIRKAIETWLPNRTTNRSRVILYYAGHGAPDPHRGDAYLVPYDGDPNYLSDTGYPLKRLYEKLEKLPAKQVVVLLDACFSGAGGRGVLAQGARSLVRVAKAAPHSNRMAVLTSTQGSQISTSSAEKKHGIFTYYLAEALNAHKHDLTEIYAFLSAKVEDEAKRLNVEQTPDLSPDPAKLQGMFMLW